MVNKKKLAPIHLSFITPLVVMFMLLVPAGTILSPTISYAGYCYCGKCCDCGSVHADHTTQPRNGTQEIVNCHTTDSFNDYRKFFFLGTYWYDYVMVGFQQMTEQLTASAFMQIEMLGMFFDADLQLETQRLLQERAAQAHKDYIPSESVCKMGTLSRSLLASEARSTMTQRALAKRSQDRQLGTGLMSASRGPEFDKKSRFDQFRRIYCNQNDNNGHLELVCPGTSGNKRTNFDINYTAAIDSKLTLNMKIEDGVIPATQEDEENVMALADNLYAHDVFSRIMPTKLTYAGNQDTYLDMRSIVAKRSVAENSFNAIAGMKASGTKSSYKYMRELMAELGVPETDSPYYLAHEDTGQYPSYYAQMELLTKKIYQDPAFITHLYDTPANVDRQRAVMESFELMQQRDIYNSLTRSEMLLAVLLEMEASKHQKRIQNDIRAE